MSISDIVRPEDDRFAHIATSRPEGAGPVHVSAFLLAVLALVATDSAAQDPEAATAATRSQQSQPRNAYAETLTPKVKPAVGRKSEPYAPIKKQDAQADIPEIEMFVGESRVFPAPGVARIAVGNGQIMSAAALDGKEMIVFANNVGTSSLFIWNADGRYQRVKINIVAGDTTRVSREVAAFLTTIPNARASVVGDKVIVEGDALTDADLAKIEHLEKRYPQIVNFTNRLGWEPMVLLDVKVVEFPVSELREIGLKWNAAGGAAIGGIWRPGRRGSDGSYQLDIQTGQGNPAPVTSRDGSGVINVPASPHVLSAVNLALNAQLNLLAQDGKAVVLSEPQLAARSGAKASFLAGGEFPYSVATRDGVTIQFKKYGVKLDIEPKVDRTGAVRATVDAEVSKIDPSVSTAAGPALLSRNTRTEFNLRSGETMILAGLIERDNSTNIDKVPLLGDIPVLGALFRSRRFQNRETELVVFVTPRIVETASPGQADRIEKVNERLEQQLGPRPYLNNPLQPGMDQGTGAEVRPQVRSHRAPDGTAARAPETNAALALPDTVPDDSVRRAAVAQAPATAAAPEAVAAAITLAPPATVTASTPVSTPTEVPTPTPVRTPAAVPTPTAVPAAPPAAGTSPAESTLSLPEPSPVPVSDSSLRGRQGIDGTESAANGSALQVQHDAVVVRRTPNERAAVLLRLARGAVLRLGSETSRDGAWRQIVVGETRGWVPSDSVPPLHLHGGNTLPEVTHAGQQDGRTPEAGAGIGAGALRAAGQPQAGGARQTGLEVQGASRRYRVILHRLALRAAPNINAEVVDHLEAGQPVRTLGQSAKQQWVAVEADGKRGWVSALWLEQDDARE